MSNTWLIQIQILFGFLCLFPKLFGRQGPVADTAMWYRYIGISFTISPPSALYPPKSPYLILVGHLCDSLGWTVSGPLQPLCRHWQKTDSDYGIEKCSTFLESEQTLQYNLYSQAPFRIRVGLRLGAYRKFNSCLLSPPSLSCFPHLVTGFLRESTRNKSFTYTSSSQWLLENSKA